MPLDLDSPYQISKVVGEFYSVYYHQRHGLAAVRARFQNVLWTSLRSWAPAAGAGRPRRCGVTSCPRSCTARLKGLPLELDNGGAASRDFVFVGDVVEGLLLCAEAGEPGDVYNLASGVETTIFELAETILTPVRVRLGAPARPPPRDWDGSGHRFGSTGRCSEEGIGFVAGTGLEPGLRQTIDWMARAHGSDRSRRGGQPC